MMISYHYVNGLRSFRLDKISSERRDKSTPWSIVSNAADKSSKTIAYHRQHAEYHFELVEEAVSVP